MIRQKLIKLMVKNYYAQCKIVGYQPITLREYLQGIKDKSAAMSQDEVEYGVNFAQQEAKAAKF